jgi:hypothetical protein
MRERRYSSTINLGHEMEASGLPSHPCHFIPITLVCPRADLDIMEKRKILPHLGTEP